MENTVSIMGLLFVLIISSGCYGTMISRNMGDFVGKYPYEAVSTSSLIMVQGVKEEPAWAPLTIPCFVIVSIPLDFVCDTILLPADLIGWGCGMDRNGPFRKDH